VELSVVVPTYREAANLGELVPRVFTAMEGAGIDGECLIVDDDSGDGTEEKCQELQRTHPGLRLIVRKGEKGLATAVLRGFAEARGQHLLVMDADLSHPPEKIPELLAASRNGAEFVIGSRYAPGGRTDETWGWFRRLNSRVATALARPLTHCKDPMAGFFCLPRRVYQACRDLSPVGYKIGLELLVKAGVDQPCEVPIVFTDRKAGESKLGFREQVRYLRHLWRLYRWSFPRQTELLLFLAVGATGLAVDTATYFGLQFALGMPHLTARAVSFLVAATSNWYLNRRITFPGGRSDHAFWQWQKFLVACTAGFVANWGTYYLLTERAGLLAAHRYLAFLLGVAAGTAFNFGLARGWVYR
jgi:dolichol-phosphate mannosyltransferase